LSVVIDASALVVLALDRDRAGAVEQHLRRWQGDGEDVHAPMLARYEIASALTRAVAAGQLSSDQVAVAWQQIASVPLVWHELSDGPAVVAMAAQLQRRSAYDAAYLVLAEQLGGELWTLDGPLARNAGARGLPVKLIDVTQDTDQADAETGADAAGEAGESP